jgi:hypothetical protein
MEREELKTLIREAFKDVAYPGNDRIARCGRSDSPIGCDECDGIAEYFKETTWQQHNTETLVGCDDAILLFKVEALHYYLPAFMIAELDNSDCMPNVYDAIESPHRPSVDAYISAKREKYVKLLSAPQRAAIVEYFKYHCTYKGVYKPDRDILQIIESLRD